METVEESVGLVAGRCLLLTLVEVDVAPPEVGGKVVGVVCEDSCDSLCCERELLLCANTEDCLSEVVRISSVVVPRELDGECALFEESYLAVYFLMHILTASSAALAEKDVNGALELDAGNDVDAETIHFRCVGITRSHEDFFGNLLGYVLKSIKANEIRRKLCHCVCLF